MITRIVSLGTAVLLCIPTLYAQLRCGTYDVFDAKFNNVGKLHNAHLQNVHRNFRTPKEPLTYEDALIMIQQFNQGFFQQNEAGYFDKPLPRNITDGHFGAARDFANNESFINALLAEDGRHSLASSIRSMETFSVMDNGNKEILRTLAALIGQSIENKISNADFENSLVNLANRWLEINDGQSAPGAQLTGYVLTIALQSCAWWRTNPDALSDAKSMMMKTGAMRSGPGYFVPSPVAVDAAGALVSGIFSISTQLINSGSVNWTQAGSSSLIGAVSSSTGLVARVARWLRNLF